MANRFEIVNDRDQGVFILYDLLEGMELWMIKVELDQLAVAVEEAQRDY